MVITRIINNNYVAAIDDDGNEAVINGRGIGFGRSKGEYLSDQGIERIYRISNSKVIAEIGQLFASISEDCFRVCGEIIDYAKKQLKKDINPTLYVTLTDHIDYAVSRVKQGIKITNPMNDSIKLYYPQEFAIGEYAVAYVARKLGVDLGEADAGFIAFHFVTALTNQQMENTVKVTQLTDVVLDMIKQRFDLDIEDGSINAQRLISHVQFIANNVVSQVRSASKSESFSSAIRTALPEEISCSEMIAGRIRADFGYELDEDELTYLAVNIARIRKRKDTVS